MARGGGRDGTFPQMEMQHVRKETFFYAEWQKLHNVDMYVFIGATKRHSNISLDRGGEFLRVCLKKVLGPILFPVLCQTHVRLK